MTEKIVVKNLYKVFGDDPEEALKLSRQGMSKDEVFNQTRQSIGVDNASFTIYEGEIFVIMGLSGSGKSTMVRLLNRLIEPSAGQVLYDGRDIAAMNKQQLLQLRRGDLSMVFQSFALMPHLNVVDNTAFGLELSGVDPETRKQRALAALQQVGLDHHASSYPDELSGGMQQRVGLARALANDPPVMLMDEAFSALDPLIRTEMQDQLLKLQQKKARTIIFISHDLDEAMRIGDRIAIMEGGRVVQVDTPETILNHPANDYVASFFRGVDVSNVLTASDIARKRQVTVIQRSGVDLRTALESLGDEDRQFAYVLGQDHQFRGVVSEASIRHAMQQHGHSLSDAFLDGVEPIAGDTSVASLIGPVAAAPCGLPVVDEQGHYQGVITRTALLETLNRQEVEANG